MFRVMVVVEMFPHATDYTAVETLVCSRTRAHRDNPVPDLTSFNY